MILISALDIQPKHAHLMDTMRPSHYIPLHYKLYLKWPKDHCGEAFKEQCLDMIANIDVFLVIIF